MATDNSIAPANNSNGTQPERKRRHGRVKKTLSLQDWADIETLAGAGLSIAKIAKAMDLSERTLRRWKRLRPELEAACEKGMGITQAEIGKTLVQKAKGGDLGAIVWWEKTRAGRREMSDITTQGQAVKSIVYVIQNAAGELVDERDAEAFDPPPEPRQLPGGTCDSPP